jgi:hypothetical protein
MTNGNADELLAHVSGRVRQGARVSGGMFALPVGVDAAPQSSFTTNILPHQFFITSTYF